jgi:hypothetical protein
MTDSRNVGSERVLMTLRGRADHSKLSRRRNPARVSPQTRWRTMIRHGGAVGRGSDDFVRHAGHDHGESFDSVAELPVVGRGGLPARRFRRSISGRDHTADKRERDIHSVRTETTCKKLPPRILGRCRFDVQKGLRSAFLSSDTASVLPTIAIAKIRTYRFSNFLTLVK